MVADSINDSILKPFTSVFFVCASISTRKPFFQLVLIRRHKHKALVAVINEVSMSGDVTTSQSPQLSKRSKEK